MRKVGYFIGFVAYLLLISNSAHAEWRKGVSDHFIFYSDGSERELRADAIRLERFDRLMRILFRVRDDGGQVKLTVYFLRGVGSVKRLYGGKDTGVAGFYETSAAGAQAVVPRIAYEAYGDLGLSADTILFHEYAHHLMLQYFPAVYPAWYVEGFAEYIGRTDILADGSAKVGLPARHRAYALLMEEQLPLERLLTARVDDIKGDGARDAFYGQSWLLVHYLSFDIKRDGQLTKYLALIGTGTESVEAARQAFGDLKTLNKDMRAYLLRNRMSYLNVGGVLAEPKALVITPLDAAAGEAVLPRFVLDRNSGAGAGEKTAEELRQLVVKYPANAELLTLLAEAEIGARRFDAAAAAADSALVLETKNSRALLWKGLALARPLVIAKDRDKAKWNAARSWIIKANRADTDSPLPLIEYFRSFLGEGRDPPQLAIDGLGMAQSLVPQDEGTRINYATALARQKKYKSAMVLLGPVANNPHGGGFSTYALQMIDRLKKAEAAGTIPELDDDGAEKAAADEAAKKGK